MRQITKITILSTFLAAMHAVILLAGFFAPYGVETQNRDLPYAPPMRVYFRDAGIVHLRPFVFPWIQTPGQIGEYREDRSRRYALRFFVQGEPYRIAGIHAGRLHLFGVDAPARMHLFGTDAYGRDLFSRTLFGGQISLLAGILATALSLSAGLLLGSLAGYYGRWLDEILMRLAELFLALPWLYLLFAIRAFLPLAISPSGAFLLLAGVIGAVGWARPARLIRGVVLSARERDYVRAARGFGASNSYILRRHIVPQTAGVMLTQASLLVPQYILAEVTLSFLGLGVSEPVPSWGNLLSSLQQYHVLASDWWMFLPAAALVPFVLGYAALATALQESTKQESL